MSTYGRIHTTSGSGDDRTDTITWYSKERAQSFLEQWNRAVKLWNDGELFSRWHPDNYPISDSQSEYASICCTWLIPNGFVEPHCVAQGE